MDKMVRYLADLLLEKGYEVFGMEKNMFHLIRIK